MLARKWQYVSVMSAAAILMSGCSIAGGLSKQEQAIVNDLAPSQYQPATRETRNNIETQDNFAQAAFWSREYQLNPADLEAAIKLSAAVRKMGNPNKAVEISQTARAMYPRDPYLLAEYAAALIASERGEDAIEALDSGLRLAPGYARLWSLKGAALDQQESYDLARKHYARALQITPRDPNVMSNLGLSYALAGDAATAETWMRRAAAQPDAGANIQQNLNLIMQLQGKEANAAPPRKSTPVLRAAPTVSQPRTYGQAVQSFESRPPRRPQAQRSAPQSYAGYETRPQPRQAARQRSYVPQKAAPQMKQTAPQTRTQAQGDFGHRSNMTIIGGQNGPQSASDMARAAAAKSRGQGQKTTVPMGQTPPAASGDILSRLSNSVGPRRMQSSASLQNQPNPQMQPQPQSQPGYPAPNYGYPQPAQPQYYGRPAAPRGAARRR